TVEVADRRGGVDAGALPARRGRRRTNLVRVGAWAAACAAVRIEAARMRADATGIIRGWLADVSRVRTWATTGVNSGARAARRRLAIALADAGRVDDEDALLTRDRTRSGALPRRIVEVARRCLRRDRGGCLCLRRRRGCREDLDCWRAEELRRLHL